MKCPEFKTHIPDYLTGDLKSILEEAFKLHMSSCSACRQEIEDINEIWIKLGVLPEEQPSKKLRSRFYNMLSETRKNLNPPANSRKLKGFFTALGKMLSVPKPALQIGISAGILMLGFLAGTVFTSQKTMERELTALKRQMQDLSKTAVTSMLRQESTFDRLNGITWSSHIKNPDEQILRTLLSILNHDPSTNVRLAAVDALYLFSDIELVKQGLIRSLSLQTSPIVQTSLINLLVELKEKKAAHALKKLIEGKMTTPEVREVAESSLQNLANQSEITRGKKGHAL